jgi:4-hydroxythreonine-4-phosphate dehydrogenase
VKTHRIALTLGDPAGIGPELILRACADRQALPPVDLLVYGNVAILRRVSDASGIPFPEASFFVLSPAELASGRLPPRGMNGLVDFPFAEAGGLSPGKVQACCGRMAAAWISAAAADVLHGKADAVVTAPINKEALHAAGVPFPGHTEMLASLTGAASPCMAFDSPKLFISLATIHEAIRDVPRLLTSGRIARVIRLTAAACGKRAGRKPRVGVLALNPHAGEHGLFGDEEARAIGPAIAACRAEGLDVSGPLVPDTAFTWLLAGRPAPFDGYVAMYHDQALILFKAAAFDSGVNVTLGLPIVRTSPDHGTAFDIAWRGKASPASLLSAIRLAVRLA